MGHLLQENEGIPLVAERDGQIIGHAEVFIGKEAPPYGYHLNISTLCVQEDFQRQGVGRALVDYIQEMAQVLACERLTVAYPQPLAFWEALGYQPFMGRQQVKLTAQEGRVFYKAHPLVSSDPKQIQGWYMVLGRYQNAREEWERMRWNIWAGVPPLVEARWHNLAVELTGQPCLAQLHQRDEDRLGVEARIWTKYQMSHHVISAIRDRAARLEYQHVYTVADQPTLALMTEGEMLGPLQWVYAKPLTP
jgi:GNAT superfamily N-acetyltransferase